MRYKVKDISAEYAPKNGCHHYWIIESADGPTSKGVCKFCGAEKEFYNSVPSVPVVPKKANHVFDLPAMLQVEMDEGSKS